MNLKIYVSLSELSRSNIAIRSSVSTCCSTAICGKTRRRVIVKLDWQSEEIGMCTSDATEKYVMDLGVRVWVGGGGRGLIWKGGIFFIPLGLFF